MVGDIFSLDLKDRAILFELDSNARASFTAIGKKCRLSKQMVKFRFERLFKQGVIDSAHASWNITKLGFSQYNIYLRFHKINPKKERELLSFLKNHLHVNWLASSDGTFDLVCATHFRSVQAFYSFLQGVIFDFDEIIQRREIMVVSNLFKFRRFYLVNHKSDSGDFLTWLAPAPLQSISNTDQTILSALVENARIPATLLAKKTGLSPEAISQHIASLRKRGILEGTILKLNWAKMGFAYFKIIIFLKQLTEQKRLRLIEFAGQHPNVIYIIEGIGVGDIHFDLEIESRAALDAFLTELRSSFSDTVSDFEILSLTQEHKLCYLPVLD